MTNTTTTTKRKSAKQTQTPVQKWIADFLSQECCGEPTNSGYDCVQVMDRESYDVVSENAYYAQCNLCGNIEAYLHKDVVREVEREANRW